MVAASGPISIPPSRLRTMLSESSTFQSWVGAADAAAALASIYIVQTDSDPGRPYALIDYAAWSRNRYTLSLSEQAWLEDPENTLALLFSATVTQAGSEPDAWIDYSNTVGAILQELEAQAGRAGKLSIQRIAMMAVPTRKPIQRRSTQGDYYESQFAITLTRQ